MDWLLFMYLDKELCFTLTNMSSIYKEFYLKRDVMCFDMDKTNLELNILESLNYNLSIRDKLYVIYDFKDIRCQEILTSMKKIKNRIYSSIDLNSFYVTEKLLSNIYNKNEKEQVAIN